MKPGLHLSLRLKFILYLIFVHLLFAAVAVYLLKQHRIWLLLVEALFIASLAIGLKLTGAFFGTIELINTGAHFIQDSDFTSRFREVGQPEMDRLVQVYNRMVDNLREERTRLQEQNYFLEKVLTASPSGIITFDFDGRISMINPSAEQIFQASGETLIGKKLAELNTSFTRTLDAIKLGESQIVTPTGRRRVKCQRSQFMDRGFGRDFILMEELTEELRQAEKTAYEKVIRMMSHEVNNSIGSANSLLHSCQHYSGQLSPEDRADFEKALDVVITRTNQLSTFMRNFADVFRLPPPQLQPCDVQKLLEEIVLLFKTACAQKRIDIRWDVGSGLSPVRLDRGQMEQVFVNILKNAIESIGTDGVITIRLSNQSGQSKNSLVTIEDSGGGISPAIQANLFTPFFSTKEHGQGIGLTLVQEILDAHGFVFSLDSEPGQPTRFTIHFNK